MRLVADVATSNQEKVKRLMIHEDKGGAYLFGFSRLCDGSSMWDEWYETGEDAKTVAQEKYRVSLDNWIQIADLVSIVNRTGFSLCG